jgi:carboxyl-terminal processing protease
MTGVSLGLVTFFVQGTWAELNAPGAPERRVTKSVAILLQRYHLARRPLDDELAGRALDNFLKALDPMKIHFLQSDIDEFMAQKNKIDDQLRDGDVQLAFDIFKRFELRIKERNEIVDAILDKPQDFTTDEVLVTDKDLLAYPKDMAEMKSRWQKRVKYDLLVLLAEDKDDTKLSEAEKLTKAVEKLRRRYHSYAKRMNQIGSDELLEMYLTAMTMGYDPHTSFMSASTLENFEIEMKKELEGIGASLQYDDGYTVVHKVIPGGAAARDGRLKVKDQIVSVGQGEDGEMVDVVDMNLSDVVKLIRGKRGTIVRLGVKPEGETATKIYNVTRDRIELADSIARSEIVESGAKPDGSPMKVGVINLPSFYMDMSGARAGKEDFRSTTRDVSKILEEFKEKHVDVVVMDLRQNGGGSLREAVNLTGLFIESGPVVMVKGFDGDVEELTDHDPTMAWSGPLVVLESKFSASASEIFAGAIQDYHRGLILGDKQTHGKGTVQQLLDLGQQIFRVPNAPKLGALKITIQQFYRPSGDSTQNRGVVADVELPSLTSHLDVGESDLDFALAFDQVKPVPFKDYGMVDNNILGFLRKQSADRIAKSEDFQKVEKNITRYEEQKEKKTVTLNEKKFMEERAELDSERANAEQAEELSDPNQPVVKQDFYFKEAMAVTLDYLDALRKTNRLAAK